MNVPRRRLVAGSLALPLAATGAQAAGGLDRLREAAHPVPPITFQDAEGRERSLAEFGGRGLVLNFWATWCAPCVAEMPALDRLAEALRPDGIEVLPLSSDRGGRGQVEPFYGRVGIRHMGIWLDPRGTAARQMGVRGLPTTVIVDRAGQERARLEGDAEWDSAQAVALVRRLAGPRPEAPART